MRPFTASILALILFLSLSSSLSIKTPPQKVFTGVKSNLNPFKSLQNSEEKQFEASNGGLFEALEEFDVLDQPLTTISTVNALNEKVNSEALEKQIEEMVRKLL